jgi:hypothetical protein
VAKVGLWFALAAWIIQFSRACGRPGAFDRRVTREIGGTDFISILRLKAQRHLGRIADFN